MSGLFITMEGGDGSGKSTQIELLAKWCREAGRDTVVTREPGGTDVGVELRDIILHSTGFISPRAEALLYAADRAQHIQTVVAPALAGGAVVVQDRYLDSSVAYQGAGRVLDPTEIRDLSLWAAEGLLPDVTFVLDLPAEVAKKRQGQSGRTFDRLEAEALDFHERVRAGYLAIATEFPERVVVIDATDTVEAIHELIVQKVSSLLD
jgi:dTMP kinase